MSQFLELCNSHARLIGWSTDQRELIGRQFTIRRAPTKIHLNVARLHELLAIDESRAGGLISWLTNPDFEPNAVPASESIIAPKGANYLSLEKNGARNLQRLCFLIELKLNVVWRCRAPFDTAF